MISHMDIRLHKYVSIIQKYWYFFQKVSFKREITNLDRPCAMPTREARKTADRRHGRSKFVISLLTVSCLAVRAG